MCTGRGDARLLLIQCSTSSWPTMWAKRSLGGSRLRGRHVPGIQGLLHVHASVYNDYMLKDYVTTLQASDISGLSQAHIRRLLENNKVKGIKRGRDWLVLASSIQQYVATRPKHGEKHRKEDKKDE